MNNNLLIIGNTYRAILKDVTEAYSNHFDNIYFLVRYNPFTEIYNMIPINCRLKNYLKPITKNSLIDLSNKQKNIEVIPTPIFYLPTDSSYKNLGEKHFKVAERTIKNNNVKFDLIHSHFLWSAGYVGAKLKEKYNVPFVVTAHGYDIYDLPFRDDDWKKKIEYVLNAADYIITVSESNLKCIGQLDIKVPIKVIPNGFNKKLFYPRDSINCRDVLNLPQDKKIILTAGSLIEIKGHKYLVDAIGEVIKHRKDVICIIIGDGELENKLQKQIRKAGLQNYIMLTGGKPHNEIPIWMNACNVFVLPSLKESFGVVQIEAMACGKPIVSTKNGGSEEIISNECLGYLIEPENSNELALGLLAAINKEWNVEKIVEHTKRYDWDIIVNDIIDIYKKIGKK